MTKIKVNLTPTEIKSLPMSHQIYHKVNGVLISSERNNKEKRQADA